MPILDRAAALDYLQSRINYERKPDAPYRESVFKLDRMRDLLALLGNPHLRLPVLHVAGTKGKGSTSAILASILAAAGFRVGLYTSPHLIDLEERLVVDGSPCSAEELVALVDRVAAAANLLDASVLDAEAEAASCAIEAAEMRRPTYFELTTAMAWLHFLDRQVDIAVLEVGLGGRLDSTNLCRPLVTTITSISLDHVRQLGGTLASIAGEKAGIIKPGVPVVSGVVESEPAAVIERRAAELESPLWRLGQEFNFRRLADREVDFAGAATETFDYFEEQDFEEQGFENGPALANLEVALIGRHQAQNAAVAVATLARLDGERWPIGERAIREGLANVRCPARVEIVAESPAVVLDVAHNVASIEALCGALNDRFGQRPKRLVFAASGDKDLRGMLGAVWPHFELVVLTRFHNSPRGVAVEELMLLAGELAVAHCEGASGPHFETAPDAESAWCRVKEGARPEHVLCVAGSFFIAAEMRALWAKSPPRGFLTV